jgi:hypothetical protein
VARSCQTSRRRRESLVAKPKKGLKKWFEKENWVDISAPKKGGGFEKCGRKSAKDSKRGYPKCVPAAKAAKMSDKQIASAVRRKRSKKQGVGGKPTNVATFAKEGGEIVRMKSKMGTKGGAMGGKKAMKKPSGMKNGGAAKKGAMMKTKGYAKGGAMRTKGGAKGGMRKPSSKNSGLYGR